VRLSVSSLLGEPALTHRLIFSYLFDYNKIEMTFLFCSSFVLLSGIMFKSGFYEEGTDEYAALKTLVISIIGACSALFVFVFASETVRHQLE
jgi:hypothetical protein